MRRMRFPVPLRASFRDMFAMRRAQDGTVLRAAGAALLVSFADFKSKIIVRM